MTINICIFTPYGHTFTFKNCAIRVDNETMLVFDYSAMSDGLMETCNIIKSNILGFSITEYVTLTK